MNRSSPVRPAFVDVSVKRLLGIVLALAAVLAIVQAISVQNGSPEVKFTDASASGLAIVPASCPSSPHYSGECSAANPKPLACSLSSSAWVITKGESAVLSWWGPQGTNAFGLPVTYISGNITSIGSVAQSGSQSVSPSQTTVYTYTGTERIAGIFNSPFACDATITVLPACTSGQTLGIDGLCHAPCPAGQARGGDGLCHAAQCSDGQAPDAEGFCNGSCPVGQSIGGDGLCHATICANGESLGTDGLCHASGCPAAHTYCGTGAAEDNLYRRSYSSAPSCSPLNALIATCRYGCASGSCIAAATTPTATINVAPGLVQRGARTQVSWFSTGITSRGRGSCTVTGTNGDTWSGFSGTQMSSPITQQTKYTISCIPYSSTTPVTQTVTVNIVPVFHEQ